MTATVATTTPVQTSPRRSLRVQFKAQREAAARNVPRELRALGFKKGVAPPPAAAAPKTTGKNGMRCSRLAARWADQEKAKSVAKAAEKAAAALAERMVKKSPCRPALTEAKCVQQLGKIALRNVVLHEVSIGASSLQAAAKKKLVATPMYINLSTRHDRHRHMETQLAKAGLEGVRFEAMTGADFDAKVVTTHWDSSLNCRYDTRTMPAKLRMSPGEIGCCMSHAILWHACAARGNSGKPILVLEDDAVLAPGFASRASRLIAAMEGAFPDPAKRVCCLYLGAEVMAWRDEKASVKPGFGLREAEYLYQTSSYIIWPAAARMLLTQLPIDAPADVWLSKQFLERKARAFVARPRLAWQKDAYCNGNIAHTNIFYGDRED